tara:strand:+ start:490 stop:684 length:195 start_codon:yes stop_codon:yes gene_type:complete
MSSFNSLGFLGFTVTHITQNPDESVTPQQVRDSIILRLASLDDSELLEVVELHDSYEEDKGCYI